MEACFVQQCQLKQKGCGLEYTGSNVTIGKAPEYNITAIEDIPAGFIEKLCFACTVRHKTLPLFTFYKDDIIITQKQLNCSKSLKSNVDYR